MRIGIRVHGGMSAARCVELAKLAEALDYHSVWFAENPFNRGVLPAMSAVAVATARIGIGIGVFNPYNRHPTLIAMETAALDELAGGRVALGIGSGIGTRVTQMGLSYDKPLAAVRDAVAITRGMLRGDSVCYEGAVFSANDARLEFTPPRPTMPIFIAAMGDGALKLTGQVGDGLMISNMCPPTFAAYGRRMMALGAAKAGRDEPGIFIQYVPCVVDRDAHAARRAAKQAIGTMLLAYWSLYARWPATKAAMLRDSGIAEREVEEAIARVHAGVPFADALDARFVESYALAGTPEDCRAGLGRYAAAGVTELVLTFAGPNAQSEMTGLASALDDVLRGPR